MATSPPLQAVSPAGDRALFRFFPGLRGIVPIEPLGRFPTPVQELDPGHSAYGSDIFVKREDLSSPLYGGNKVRTLEQHFGQAQRIGADRIWASGAYGSNHATASLLHSARLGIGGGIVLFHQAPSTAAHENFLAMMSTVPEIVDVGNVALFPAALAAVKRRAGQPYVMGPGGATPLGALGHVGAGLELAEQVAAGLCPPPRSLVLAVGSTCTTAGLMVGLALAAKLGVAFGPGRAPLPRVHAVRATPWPITSRWRILGLARKTVRFLQSHLGAIASVSERRMASLLTVHQRFIGRGYGRPMASTRGAMALMSQAGGPALDTVYSGKSAACLFQLALSANAGPILYWATKSTAALPTPNPQQLAQAPARMRAWLDERRLD